jgi:multidrug efflux pump subunit AcrA (membrane-fusion protein)
MGSLVNTGTVLASLVDIDKYWVQVSVGVDELRWIAIPSVPSQKGSRVRVYYESAWGPDAYRTGTVERLLPDLEPQGRMARLLIAVTDPLQRQVDSTERYALILGAYVRVQIEGQELQDVIQVPRTALRDGMNVWIMQADNTLDIRRVNAVWNGNDHVYVDKGLAQGDLLIISDLATPVQSMALRTADSAGPERLAKAPDGGDGHGGEDD